MWEKIDNHIKEKNLTIYELTKKANIAQNTLYELKSGRANDLRFSTVCKIADALEISLDEFRTEDKPEEG
ncbi:helix-turn-helix transcriptional regulator [Carnobacterium sp. ISL-102]|uniref:helix-turn-helix domain-containing protein n=1 Tax=Carnobacterium sp. ISL-102 TaxID=2819142 RepID=UPI001BE7D75A|nr:helix-turn-helix transcriptional regulator [Carnobacterium sp. ISL-102]MBT2732088.1 helix-turn-helix transcriptional regulator [Carnobacterium sp. ISL-102]